MSSNYIKIEYGLKNYYLLILLKRELQIFNIAQLILLHAMKAQRASAYLQFPWC